MNSNGVLKVKLIRGKNLAVRDLFTSDPYVKILLSDQAVQSHVKKRTLNPEWNEDFTLRMPKTLQPLKVYVYDHDIISRDDKMGNAEIDLGPLLKSAGQKDEVVLDSRNLRTASCKPQKYCVKLNHVESGELELELLWIPPPL